jgi:hypothetical protein
VKIIYKSFCPPCNLGAFAPWREKFPTRKFARVSQILNYSNTKSTKLRSFKRIMSETFVAGACPESSRRVCFVVNEEI